MSLKPAESDLNRKLGVSVGSDVVCFWVRATERYRRFWDQLEGNSWEPHTVALFASVLRPGARFIDVGAWIGPTTLLAAAMGAQVLAVEPDPAALEELKANISLNPLFSARIEVDQVALGMSDGNAVLSAKRLGDSMSSVVHSRRNGSMTIQVATVDAGQWAICHSVNRADLMKIDVEGSEFGILRAMLQQQLFELPTTLLSVHYLGRRPRGVLRSLRLMSQLPLNCLVRASLLRRLQKHGYEVAMWQERRSTWAHVDAAAIVRTLIASRGFDLLIGLNTGGETSRRTT